MRRDGAAEDADADDAVIDKSCFAYCCPYKDKYTAIAGRDD